MVERLTEEHITMDLETLGHGGGEAIALFFQMSKRLHEDDADWGLHDWVTVAAPALPEKERNEVLVLLLSCFLRSNSSRFPGSAETPLHLDA